MTGIRHSFVVVVALVALSAARPLPGSAQTVRGRLLESGTTRSIEAAVVSLVDVSGDTVARTLTGERGGFVLTAKEPGVFAIAARAFGYRSYTAPGFELGPDGEMSVDFRLVPRPIELEELVVGFNRPIVQHKLVENGFIDRFEEGFGVFVTPVDIERAPSSSTVDLFRGLPGVTVRAVGGGFMAYAGERVMLLGQNAWCTPRIYLDGIRLDYTGNVSLDALVPKDHIIGVEIFRRASEVPVQYNATRTAGEGSSESGPCGVILLWTK